MDTDRLEDAIDHSEIRRVQDAYADIVSRRQWAELADVFRPDTVLDLDLREQTMQFVGSDEGHLVFVRIRELLPEDQLSPARSHTMRLDSQRVGTVSVDGRPVWPGGSQSVGVLVRLC